MIVINICYYVRSKLSNKLLLKFTELDESIVYPRYNILDSNLQPTLLKQEYFKTFLQYFKFYAQLQNAFRQYFKVQAVANE